jgi:hypothetical protein
MATSNPIETEQAEIEAYKRAIIEFREKLAEKQGEISESWKRPEQARTLSIEYAAMEAEYKAMPLVLEKLQDNLRAFRVEAEEKELKELADQSLALQIKRDEIGDKCKVMRAELEQLMEQHRALDGEAGQRLGQMEIVAHHLIKLGVDPVHLQPLADPSGYTLRFPYLFTDADV